MKNKIKKFLKYMGFTVGGLFIFLLIIAIVSPSTNPEESREVILADAVHSKIESRENAEPVEDEIITTPKSFESKPNVVPTVEKAQQEQPKPITVEMIQIVPEKQSTGTTVEKDIEEKPKPVVEESTQVVSQENQAEQEVQAPVKLETVTKYYTSSHHSAKYYYPENCSGWEDLSPNFLRSFSSLESLLGMYSRSLSPEC